MQYWHPYYCIQSVGPLAHHFTARFTMPHCHPGLHTFTWDGQAPVLESARMGTAVIEHAASPMPMDPDLADVPDMVVRECITNWQAPPDVKVTYAGYYRRYFLTMMAVLPEERHGRHLSIYAEWDLSGFSDGTVQIQCACAAVADIQVMDTPQQILDYYSALDFPPWDKTTETLRQFEARCHALCHRIETAPWSPEMAEALQREPVTLEAYNATHGLRADVPLQCFEE